MSEFCKIFIVNDTQILIRKSIQVINGKPVPHIFFNAFLEENYLLNINPEVEFSGTDCCPYHMNERYDTIDQAFAERIYHKMKEYCKKGVQQLILNKEHQN